MKNNTNQLKEYINKFKKMKAVQNLLHIIFVISVVIVIVLRFYSLITQTNFMLTLLLLGVFGIWLLFVNLHKQNQVFGYLKKIYKDSVYNKKI